jgi:tRNA modification GTPase
MTPVAADTIVAVATAPGRGGIGIVRVSGPAVPAITRALTGDLPAPRYAHFTRFLDASGAPLDEGIALYFAAPQSYTGEHVLELQAHGSPVVLELLVARAVELGARRALPGEFTQRAYLNDHMDLAQAEAVADLIDAGSEAAARAALRSLGGEFSHRVQVLDASLAALRVHVEAAIDFPAEEIEFLADNTLTERLAEVRALCATLRAEAQRGRVLTEGITVVIAGAPNAGKSTLLNRLAGHEAAITSSLPGTTRDVLRERVLIQGTPVTVLDTAGLRDAGESIEAEGVRRARAALARADHVLFVVDAEADPQAKSFEAERASLPAGVPVTVVYNKSDRLAGQAGRMGSSVAEGAVRISALTGAGVDALCKRLLVSAGVSTSESGTLSARGRHLHALARTAAFIEAASGALRDARAGELMAEELKAAQAALGEITGQRSADEVLGEIFAGFCIGK